MADRMLRNHNNIDNYALLHELAEDMNIPLSAWTMQDVFMSEDYLLVLQGQKMKVPMYRFRPSRSQPSSIVCILGKWTDRWKKGQLSNHIRGRGRNLMYGKNYMDDLLLIVLERSRETGKLVAKFNGTHTTWESLKNSLGITSEHIPMPFPTQEQLERHKQRKEKIFRRCKSPPPSDDESEDSYNS